MSFNSLWSFFHLREDVIMAHWVIINNFFSPKELICHQNFWKALENCHWDNLYLLSFISAYIISCIKAAWKIHSMLMCGLWRKFNFVRHNILSCKQKMDLIKHYLFHTGNSFHHWAYFRHLTLWFLKFRI